MIRVQAPWITYMFHLQVQLDTPRSWNNSPLYRTVPCAAGHLASVAPAPKMLAALPHQSPCPNSEILPSGNRALLGITDLAYSIPLAFNSYLKSA